MSRREAVRKEAIIDKYDDCVGCGKEFKVYVYRDNFRCPNCELFRCTDCKESFPRSLLDESYVSDHSGNESRLLCIACWEIDFIAEIKDTFDDFLNSVSDNAKRYPTLREKIRTMCKELLDAIS